MVNQITFLLGFSEPDVFRMTFKKGEEKNSPGANDP